MQIQKQRRSKPSYMPAYLLASAGATTLTVVEALLRIVEGQDEQGK